VVEGALHAKHHDSGNSRKKNFKKNQLASNENGANNQNKSKGKRKNYPPCQHCGKMGHPPFKCWRRLDAKCSKCNQLGHKAVICKSKFQQPEANAQVVEQDVEDYIFAATCYSMRSSSECWLIDSGCTNRMTYDKSAFKDLKPIDVLNIKIGNGDYIQAKGKGTILIATISGAKLISDVLYVPEIDQNLLSVGQLLEKGFKLSFAYQHCLIYDIADQKVLRVKMRGKSFSFDPIEEKHATYFTKSHPRNSGTRDWVIAILKEC